MTGRTLLHYNVVEKLGEGGMGVVWKAHDVRKRGEKPVALAVEPGGAEFAQPLNGPDVNSADREAPDPKGRIVRDKGKLIRVEAAVVPPTKATGLIARVHIEFQPNARLKAHWNNEASPLVVWVEPLADWQTNGRYRSIAYPSGSTATLTSFTARPMARKMSGERDGVVNAAGKYPRPHSAAPRRVRSLARRRSVGVSRHRARQRRSHQETRVVEL